MWRGKAYLSGQEMGRLQDELKRTMLRTPTEDVEDFNALATSHFDIMRPCH